MAYRCRRFLVAFLFNRLPFPCKSVSLISAVRFWLFQTKSAGLFRQPCVFLRLLFVSRFCNANLCRVILRIRKTEQRHSRAGVCDPSTSNEFLPMGLRPRRLSFCHVVIFFLKGESLRTLLKNNFTLLCVRFFALLRMTSLRKLCRGRCLHLSAAC